MALLVPAFAGAILIAAFGVALFLASLGEARIMQAAANLAEAETRRAALAEAEAPPDAQ